MLYTSDNLTGTLMLYTADNLTGSIDEPVEDGDTALHLTCLYGHLACVQVYYLCLFLCLYTLITALHELLILFDKLQLLLERGANIEANDEDGAIPLHDACAGGSLILKLHSISWTDIFIWG